MLKEYSKDEWKLFSKTEQKLLVLILKHGIENGRLRNLVNWPLEEPMNDETMRGHMSRIKKKVEEIREKRVCNSAQK